MKLPLVLEESGTVRDADGRVVISKINPCTIQERREIVHAVNGRKDMERKIAGQRAAIRALESTISRISQPNRGARVKAETTEAKDATHGSVRKW